MKQNYIDIMSRIPEEPKWFDENGVPRYDTFRPWDVANIYWNQAVLMKVACQGCDKTFHVAMTARKEEDSLKDKIANGSLHYGDPPNVDCCSGNSMNSIPLGIEEFHEKQNFEVKRNPLYEGQYDGWNGSVRPAGASGK